jgi:hypothetical protein
LPPCPGTARCNSIIQHEANGQQTVARALREHCNIPFESFFLATHLGGGKFAYFTGPRPMAEEEIRKMFRREKFLQFQNRTQSSMCRAHTVFRLPDTDLGQGST